MATHRNIGAGADEQKRQAELRSALRRAVKRINSENLDFGTSLVLLRETAALSQVELAERIGVTRSAVARWETKRAFPRDSMINNLESSFEIQAGTLRSAAIRSDIEV